MVSNKPNRSLQGDRDWRGGQKGKGHLGERERERERERGREEEKTTTLICLTCVSLPTSRTDPCVNLNC